MDSVWRRVAVACACAPAASAIVIPVRAAGALPDRAPVATRMKTMTPANEMTGLAAYDAQRTRSMAVALPTGQAGSYAIVGALALYLDFINLFLMLLRLSGSRRD